jgi:hypothetical protein
MLTGRSGWRAFIVARAVSSSVASTSTQTVASGISRRERLSLSAAALRAPRSGIRSSSPAVLAAAVRSAGAAAAGVRRSIACSTSRRRTRPDGPLPASAARSTPASCAIFRTSGEITGTRPGAWRRGPPPASPGPGPERPFRTCLRRRDDPAEVPYPTRTLPLSPAVTGVTMPGSRRPAASLTTLISGAPTGTTCPSRACRAATRPANGTGTSTAAFAVSTSTTIWSVPTSSPT